MKEQTLLEMKNKIESLGRVVQHLLTETNNLRELSVGTLETLKLIDGYDAAIEELKRTLTENIEGQKEAQNEKEELPT